MSDNYPSDEQLAQIKAWPYTDFDGLMDYVHSLWWNASWGWRSENGTSILGNPVVKYKLATGGWSGNESLIEALNENTMFWMMCWQQSRRGGGFDFEVAIAPTSPPASESG